MSIVVLGPISADGASLGPRDRVVLAALAMRIGEAVSAERLADALWGDRPPRSWNKVVQGCVMRLRKSLGAGAIETLPDGYRLAVPLDEVDAHRFERLVRRGQQLLALREPDRAAHTLDEALALWRGRALADLQQWDAGRIEAERLEQLRLDAQEAQLDAALQAGRHREVLGEAQARVAEEPLRERRWALLALAQYQAGRQAEALRTLHRARTMLSGELGLDPGPDLVELEAAILRQDVSLTARDALAEPSAICPYLGLLAYDVADADAFFGRDADVAACVQQLTDRGVLALVGPSGCGKSSLVRAGVGAALERDRRRVVIITPGVHPLDALTALPTGGPVPVLVVDQCEEAITLCQDPDERAQFFNALTAHAERGPLAVALRADRLGNVSAHPRFARLIEQGMYLLSAMDEADLRAAIEGPARQAGLLLEPGLVGLLVREVEGEPGALPLLSHALRKTWERREGRTLTVAGYHDSGGIRGAIAQSAEELYERIPEDQRPQLRDLLLRLVVLDPEGAPVRSRVPRRLLAADGQPQPLIELLVGARLVTSDDGVVELAHEALTRAWPRLRSWLDEDVEGQRIRSHLTTAAATWDAMGRPDSELYRGVRRTKAVEWMHRAKPALTPLEQAFLDASDKLVEMEAQAAEARVAVAWLRDLLTYETRVNRRVRAVLSGIGVVLLVIATSLAVVAVGQTRRAQREVRIAEARALAAASVANLDADPERSILLALEAVKATREDGTVLPEAEEAVHRAIQRSRLLRTVPRGYGLAVSPDGRRFGTTGEGGAVIWETDTGRRTLTLRYDAWCTNVAMSPDGRRIATSHSDGTVGIWDATAGRRLHLLQAHESRATGPQFSPDSRTVVTTGADGTVRLWNTRTGAERMTMADNRGATYSPRFNPDGSRLIVANEDNTARIWDVATGEPELLLEGHEAVVQHAVFSPDGARVATGGEDGTIRIADADTGELLMTLFGGGAIRGIDYSADGRRIAAGGDDGVALVWDAHTGQQVLTLPGHPAGIQSVAFTPGGRRLVTTGRDSSARVWDVSVGGGRDWLTVRGPRVRLTRVAFRPGGATFASPGDHDGVVLRDARSGAQVRALSGAGPVQDVVFSPDGTQVAGTVRDDAFTDDDTTDVSMVPVWDVRTGELVTTLHDVGDLTTNVVYSPNGRLLVTGASSDDDGTITVWSATSGVRRLAFDVDHAVTQVGFSPDGRVLATGGWGGDVTIWDTTGRRMRRLPPHDQHVSSMVFTPDGRLLTGSYDGTAKLWDVDTGEHLLSLRGHAAGVAGVAVSTDGTRMATASEDSTVKIWDARTGRPQLTLHGHEGGVHGVAFSPDGRLLASSGPDGRVMLHLLTTDELLELARSRVTRSLTDDECRQYLHVPRCRGST